MDSVEPKTRPWSTRISNKEYYRYLPADIKGAETVSAARLASSVRFLDGARFEQHWERDQGVRRAALASLRLSSADGARHLRKVKCMPER